MFYDAAELDVTALAAARDGSVYAGTSPDGKVYRITEQGQAEVFFDPADKYIWSLAVTRRWIASRSYWRQRQALSRSHSRRKTRIVALDFHESNTRDVVGGQRAR